MSSTSSSRVQRDVAAVLVARLRLRLVLAHARRRRRRPVAYQAGIWWPHQSWRETHQGSMFSSHWK